MDSDMNNMRAPTSDDPIEVIKEFKLALARQAVVKRRETTGGSGPVEDDAGPVIDDDGAVTDVPDTAPPGITFTDNGKNTLEYRAGLPTESGIIALSGLTNTEKLRKHPEFAAALDAIRDYQDEADAEVSSDKVVSHGRKVFNSLQNVMRKIDGAREKFTGSWLARRSSTLRGLMPALNSVYIKATTLLPRVAGAHTIYVTYAANRDIENTRFSDLMLSPEAAYLSDKSVSVMENQSGGIDASAAALQDYNQHKQDDKQDQTKVYNRLMPSSGNSILQKVIPAFGAGMDTAAVLTELRVLARDLQDSAMLVASMTGSRSRNNAETVQDAHIRHFALVKLLAAVLANPGVMEHFISPETVNAATDPDGAELANQLRLISGKSLDDASRTSQNAFLSTVEIMGSRVKKVGDAASVVYLDFENRRALRTSVKTENSDAEKESNNGYFDEALSRLSELFKKNLIAFSRVAAYKAPTFDEGGNVTGTSDKVTYGSTMSLAGGKEARSFNFALDVQRDTPKMANAVRGGKVDSTRQTYDIMNPRLVNDVLMLQVIDFISKSVDRHAGNFFIDFDAGEGQSMVTGIDNDKAFGEGNVNDAANYALYDDTGGALKGGAGGGSYNATTLANGFGTITQPVLDMINSVTVDQVAETLRPYLSRPALAAALHRTRVLQDFVKGSQVVDLGTDEGKDTYRQYLQNTIVKTVAERSRITAKLSDGDTTVGGGIASQSGNYLVNLLIEGFIQPFFGSGTNTYENTALEPLFSGLAHIGVTQTALLNALVSSGRIKEVDKEVLIKTKYFKMLAS